MKKKLIISPAARRQVAEAKARRGQPLRAVLKSRPSDVKQLRLKSTKAVEPPSGWLRLRRKEFKRETKAQVIRWQRENIRLLLKGSEIERALAVKLRACSDDTPCASEACLNCMYEFRTRLLDQAVSLVNFGDWTVASIIPEKMQVPLGELGSFDVKKNVRRLQKRIERSEFLRDQLLLGGLDISLNVELGTKPFWQIHIYLMIANSDTPELRNAVCQTFPKQVGVRAPYWFREVVDQLEAISYTYKSIFNLRPEYIDDDLEFKVGRDQMPDYAKPELLLFLDSYAIGTRMLLRGFRRHGRLLNLKVISNGSIWATNAEGAADSRE